MISAQTPQAFVARENRYTLFRIMLYLIKLMKVMDRAVAVSDAKAVGRFDRRRDPYLGAAHGLLQRFATGEAGGDRRR